MRTTIVRNIFINVGALFALTGPLAAETFITFDVPGASTAPLAKPSTRRGWLWDSRLTEASPTTAAS